MGDFNQKREAFLGFIKPLFNQEFHNSQDKSMFLERWKKIVKKNEFCKLKFSYESHLYENEEDNGEYHQDFQFTSNFDYVDCTRKNNPDCISGELCFCFGQGASGTELAYIHTASKNMVIIHDDNIYLSKDIDNEVSGRLTWGGISFLDFIYILKPEVTNTTLMKKGKYSNWLEIEKDNLSVRFSSNLSPDDKWESESKVFDSHQKANEFYLSTIEKYAKENTLTLSSCSDDIKFDIEKILHKFS